MANTWKLVASLASALRRSCVFGGTLLVAGCTTTLEAMRVPASGEPIEGQVYYLPRVDFLVTVDRELTSCTVAYADDAEAVLEWIASYASLMIARANGIAEASKFFESVLKDPILQRRDIAAFLAARLGANWQSIGKPINGDQTKLSSLIATRAPERANPVLRLGVEFRAQAQPLLTQDPKHMYAIRYQGMQEFMKGTDYSVENYPNGTLRSINVTLDDQTGAVIQGIVNGVAKLAAASSGFPLSLVTAHAAARAVAPLSFAEWKRDVADSNALCNSSTRLKLLQRAALETQAEDDADNNLLKAKKTEKLEEVLISAVAKRDAAKAELDDLEDGDPKKPAAAAALSLASNDVKAAKKAVADSRAEQMASSEAAGKVVARLTAIRKALTFSKVTTIRPEPGATPTFSIEGIDEAAEAWLDMRRSDAYCRGQSVRCQGRWPIELVRALKVQAAIYPQFATATPVSTVITSIVYRQPVRATLFVCKEQDCLGPNGTPAAPETHVLLSSQVDVPQFGALATLPLKNGPFQNNSISASFSENGALTKVTYKSNAAAAKAAEVFESSADTVLKYKDAKRKQETTKLENSATEVQARTKLLEAQLALEKAQADLDNFSEEKIKPTN